MSGNTYHIPGTEIIEGITGKNYEMEEFRVCVLISFYN